MPYRCSTCDINWPAVGECGICGGRTWYTQSVATPPDEIAPPTEELPVFEGFGPRADHTHRVERYLALGFDEVQAQLLAVAVVHATTTNKRGEVKHYTSPLHHCSVALALAAGCSHLHAIAVFA